MLDLPVADIAAATAATIVCGDTDKQVTAVETDSRRVAAGTLFVCFPGERVDGNDFAASAVKAGAAAIALTREPSCELVSAAQRNSCALLRVADDDPTEFMLRLAEAWRLRNPQWAVIGVTGSVGKTTTKDLLAAGLGACWKTHATAGNFNNLIGLPLTLLSADPSDEVVICEMGMNHKGELSRLTKAARPSVALITNVGTSHIGLLGSRENIARAKAEIIEGLQLSAVPQQLSIGEVHSCLVMTSDNDFAPFIEKEFCRPAAVETSYVGEGEKTSLSCGSIALDELGRPEFDVSFSDGTMRHSKLELPGAAVVSDYLLALAIAERLGAKRDMVCSAMEHMPASHMRLEVVGGGEQPRLIDDSYNASPTSMAAALDVLASLPCTGRRIAVLGEMGEMGDESARLHEYVGCYAAAKKPDLIVWVGTKDAALMREAALVMGFSDDHMESFADAASALATIKPILNAKDLVLVKASRSAGLDAFVKGVLA